MNADSFEEETASARSETKETVTNEGQAPKVQVLLLLALIGVHRRPSAVPCLSFRRIKTLDGLTAPR
jgi:hypothetical protein